MDEEMEETCFQIIANVGMAKSNYITAIELAKELKFDEAEAAVAEGNANYQVGHKAHTEMLQRDAAGEREAGFSLLLVHAEDQMMNAETFRVVAEDFIDVYRKLERA